MFLRIIKTFALGAVLLTGFVASLATPSEVIDAVNTHPSSTWVAGYNHLTNLTEEEVLPLMGTALNRDNIFFTESFREGSDIECSLCQAALGWVEKEVAGNATVSRIEQALNDVCHLAPVDSLRTFCETIVNNYTPELINYILAKESPQVICQALGICKSAKRIFRPHVQLIHEVTELECTLCHYIFEWVENYIQNERTMTKIEEALDHVCAKIPQRYQTKCVGFVQNFTPQLIHYIMSKETPEVVCHQLGVCADKVELEGIPDNFDGRVVFGSCIHPVRDQGKCGSCWAVSASEVLSDRFCIASKKAVNVILSPENLVECDHANHGCQGGMLNTAWDFMVTSGLVSEACMPYTSGAGVVGGCPTSCADGSDIHKVYKAINAHHVWSITGLVAKIQTELMNGPVQAAFEVYQDFIAYKTGVYHHVAGSLLGGHAIELVGWGVENSQPYWLAKNSWGTSWGISGYFKILRGKNECGIESNIYAGTPQL